MSTRVHVVADSGARALRWLAATRCLTPEAGARGRDRPWRQRTARERLRVLAPAVQSDDPCSRSHATRVGALSGRLALAIGLTADEAEVVALAGVLHDIGVLGEPGTAGDDTVHRRHPLIGAQLVAPFDLLGLVAPMVRHHHERLDGSGYPDGLRGAAIPLGARIIAVADEYDRLGMTAHGRAASREAALSVRNPKALSRRVSRPTVRPCAIPEHLRPGAAWCRAPQSRGRRVAWPVHGSGFA